MRSLTHEGMGPAESSFPFLQSPESPTALALLNLVDLEAQDLGAACMSKEPALVINSYHSAVMCSS
jgi:hypothetical protein